MFDFKVTLTALLAAGMLMTSCGGDNNDGPVPPQPSEPEVPVTADVRVLTTTSNRAKDHAIV